MAKYRGGYYRNGVNQVQVWSDWEDYKAGFECEYAVATGPGNRMTKSECEELVERVQEGEFDGRSASLPAVF